MITLDPTRYYQYSFKPGAPAEPYMLQGVGSNFAVANNQSVIAGVASYFIAIMGWNIAAGNGGDTSCIFKDNNTTTKFSIQQKAGGTPNIMPPGSTVLYTLSTASSLTVDVATTGAVINIWYLLLRSA